MLEDILKVLQYLPEFANILMFRVTNELGPVYISYLSAGIWVIVCFHIDKTILISIHFSCSV